VEEQCNDERRGNLCNRWIANIESNYRKTIFEDDHARFAENINAYLVNGPILYVESRPSNLNASMPRMITGSVPNDGGNLILSESEKRELTQRSPALSPFILRFLGSLDFIQGFNGIVYLLMTGMSSWREASLKLSNVLSKFANCVFRAPRRKQTTFRMLPTVFSMWPGDRNDRLSSFPQ
jgi:hypothetical protein